MNNMQPSFNNIKDYAKYAFEKALEDNLTPLQQAKSFRNKLKETNHSLYEMFHNDFSYEINSHQAKHFLKTGMLLSIDDSIPTMPSVWVLAWGNNAIKGIKKLNINKDFDIRKYPFEDFKYAVDKLSMIFEHVYSKNEKNAKNALSMKDDIIPHYSFYNVTDQIVQNAFIDTIYRVATIQSFGKKIKEEVWSGIINFYYGEYKKSNEDVFATHIYGARNQAEKDERFKTLRKKKEEALTLRDQDVYYWKHFISIDKDGSFLEQLKKEIDINQDKIGSITHYFYTKNNHDIMQAELKTASDKKLTKKTVKI